MQPLVSVIIPAFRARTELPEAIASIRSAGLPEEQLEVIVASDDGSDYRSLLPDLPMLTFTRPGPVQTGAGPARNRAQDIATGTFVAFLDADDTWAPGYLSDLLPLARRNSAAFGPTAILDHGKEILRLPRHGSVLRLEDLGRTGASFHPVIHRRYMRPFSEHLSQDVRHAAEILGLLGDSAPLGTVPYRLNLRQASTTASANFSNRVAHAYAAHVEEILSGDLPPDVRQTVAQVFIDKQRLNAAYVARARPGQSFYAFVAERLSAPASMPTTIETS